MRSARSRDLRAPRAGPLLATLLAGVPFAAAADVPLCGSPFFISSSEVALGVTELVTFEFPAVGPGPMGLYLTVWQLNDRRCPYSERVSQVVRLSEDRYQGVAYGEPLFPNMSPVGTIIEFDTNDIHDWYLDLGDPQGRVHGGINVRTRALRSYGSRWFLEALPPGAEALHPNFLPAHWNTDAIEIVPLCPAHWYANGPEPTFCGKFNYADGFGNLLIGLE